MDDSEDSTLIPDKDYNAVFRVLDTQNISITELLTVLLTDRQFKNHPALDDLLGNAGAVVTSLLHHCQLSDSAQDQTCAGVEHIYAKEIVELVKASSGWHFGAHHASQGDLDLSSWEQMAQKFTVTAPRLWSLLDTLLLARKRKDSLILDRDAMVADGPDFEHSENHQLDADEVLLEGNVHLPSQSTLLRKKKLINIVQVFSHCLSPTADSWLI